MKIQAQYLKATYVIITPFDYADIEVKEVTVGVRVKVIASTGRQIYYRLTDKLEVE